ncbi:hypothetical protein GCM10010965_29810 [Caldalkalibacillus thermarum]|nr:hypothetical protein GCM10010965_29810 [Caldalkalibacillus thermarum]
MDGTQWLKSFMFGIIVFLVLLMVGWWLLFEGGELTLPEWLWWLYRWL